VASISIALSSAHWLWPSFRPRATSTGFALIVGACKRMVRDLLYRQLFPDDRLNRAGRKSRCRLDSILIRRSSLMLHVRPKRSSLICFRPVSPRRASNSAQVRPACRDRSVEANLGSRSCTPSTPSGASTNRLRGAMPPLFGLATLTRQRSMNTKRPPKFRFQFPRRVYNGTRAGPFSLPLWYKVKVVG
jgi:hypothetical protein